MVHTVYLNGKAIINFDEFQVGSDTYKNKGEWLETAKPNPDKNYLIIFQDENGAIFRVESKDEALNLEKMSYTFDDASVYHKEVQLFKKSVAVVSKLKKLHAAGIEMNFTFVDKKGHYFKNDDTGNINSASSWDWGYCVYGQFVNNGQVDSRTNSDDEIRDAILVYLLAGARLQFEPLN